MSYVYNNGIWNYVADGNTTTNNSNNNSGGSSTTTPFIESAGTDIGDANLVPEYTDTNSDEAKDYIEEERSTIEGDMEVLTPNPHLKAKKTVQLKGVGKALSGRYYVEKVTHTFDSNGYSQKVSVSKGGFGDYIKKGRV